MIFGGFGGHYFRDSFVLNCGSNIVTKTDSQLPTSVFPFAVPTLSDGKSFEVYSVDWATYKLFVFKDEKWSQSVNLRVTGDWN